MIVKGKWDLTRETSISEVGAFIQMNSGELEIGAQLYLSVMLPKNKNPISFSSKLTFNVVKQKLEIIGSMNTEYHQAFGLQ